MKNIPYQQNAINELTDKTIRLLNLGGKRHKIVFEAPTGAGKTTIVKLLMRFYELNRVVTAVIRKLPISGLHLVSCTCKVMPA